MADAISKEGLDTVISSRKTVRKAHHTAPYKKDEEGRCHNEVHSSETDGLVERAGNAIR